LLYRKMITGEFHMANENKLLTYESRFIVTYKL